jgi:acetate kinase
MPDAILVLNAGSSSIKFSVFTPTNGTLHHVFLGQLEGLYTSPKFKAKTADGAPMEEKSWGEGVKLGHEGAIEYLRAFLRANRGDLTVAGVGHRVCHGGLKYSHPIRVDEQVVADLERFIPLAPLHQPHNVAPIRLVTKLLPDIPQVACFDTAFHRSNPMLAQLDRGGCAPIRVPRIVI